MSTPLVILLTAILTAFGTKLVEQIFKEIADVRAARKGRGQQVYHLERRLSQLIVIANHFRNIGVRNGVDLGDFDLPEEFDGWDEPVDT